MKEGIKYTEEQQISDIGFILNQHKGYVNTNFITVIMLETDKQLIYADVMYDKDGVDNKEFIQKVKKHALHKLEQYIDKESKNEI